MIESCYWKEELTRVSRSLRAVPKPPRWTERGHCIIERDIMIGFFIVRRMIELHKISSATRDTVLRVFSVPARGKTVTRMNRHDIEELYDLERERHETKKPLYMSNQFIHCYTSFVARDESRNWSDVFVVSDFDRNSCIWRVPIPEIQRLFATVAKDYPHSLRMVFSEKEADYVISTN
jgi:hypothetical protein